MCRSSPSSQHTTRPRLWTGRVGGGAGADGNPGGAAEDPQEAAVARGLAVVRGEPGDVPGRQELQEGGFHPVQVPVVGHDDDGAAAGQAHGRHGLGNQAGPAAGTVALERAEHGPRRLPRAQVLQEGRAVAVGGPAGGFQTGGDGRTGPVVGPVGEEGRVQDSVGSEVLLEFRHPRRHGDAEDVADAAGVARRDPVGQVRDGGRQHRDRRDHLVQRDEGVAGVGFRHPFDQVSGQFLAVELHLHPDTRLRRGVEPGGHAVVEGPVKVRKGGLEPHPGHRKPVGEGWAGGRGCGGRKALEQRQLEGLVRRGGAMDRAHRGGPPFSNGSVPAQEAPAQQRIARPPGSAAWLQHITRQ